nr:hypothetical protein [uncultured Sphingobacterium sp.]
MKEIKKMIAIISIGLLCSTTLFSCKNSSNSKEGTGQSDNIAPSDADETRYNLSEQQKMSMQKDTTLADTTQQDSTP